MSNPFPANEAEAFANLLAGLMDANQAHTAKDGLRAYLDGKNPSFSMDWGIPVRNYTRHYGFAFDEELLDEHWWLLLERAVDIRLDPAFQPPSPQNLKTHPEFDDRVGGTRWICTFPAELDASGDLRRIFAFYDTGWFEEILSQMIPERRDLHILQCGRYKMGSHWIDIHTTEYEGQPFPSEGAAFRIEVQATNDFDYSDFLFRLSEDPIYAYDTSPEPVKAKFWQRWVKQ